MVSTLANRAISPAIDKVEDERRVDGDGRVQGRRQAARTISCPCDGDPGFAVELKRHTAPIAGNYIARFLSYPCHLHLDPFKRRVHGAHRSTGNALFRKHVPRLERLTQFHFDSFRGDRPNLWETELQMRTKPLLFKVAARPPQMGEHLDKVAFDKFRQHEAVVECRTPADQAALERSLPKYAYQSADQ